MDSGVHGITILLLFTLEIYLTAFPTSTTSLKHSGWNGKTAARFFAWAQFLPHLLQTVPEHIWTMPEPFQAGLDMVYEMCWAWIGCVHTNQIDWTLGSSILGSRRRPLLWKHPASPGHQSRYRQPWPRVSLGPPVSPRLTGSQSCCLSHWWSAELDVNRC